MIRLDRLFTLVHVVTLLIVDRHLDDDFGEPSSTMTTLSIDDYGQFVIERKPRPRDLV